MNAHQQTALKTDTELNTAWQATRPSLAIDPISPVDSQARMSRLLSVLPAGVIVIDGQGCIQECNPAAIRLLGEPLQGETWISVIQRAFKPRPDDGHDVSLADGRIVNISTNPLDGEAGQIVLLHEVTETRQLQNKVSHMQRLSAMGEMAARLAHQIRTPLSSAMLYVAPLLKDDVSPVVQQKFSAKLHESLLHLEELVKNMLTFSRGDMATSTPFSVQQLLSSIAQQFSAEVPEHIQFSVENHTDDSQLFGSQTALSSAINNLLNNARQACSDSVSHIRLVADYAEDNQGIDISVEDDGQGIAADEFSKIMQPFYTTRTAGTGLGLAVVQSIAKAHKGELWVDSHLGEGSTFSVRLPIYQPTKSFSNASTTGVSS